MILAIDLRYFQIYTLLVYISASDFSCLGNGLFTIPAEAGIQS